MPSDEYSSSDYALGLVALNARTLLLSLPCVALGERAVISVGIPATGAVPGRTLAIRVASCSCAMSAPYVRGAVPLALAEREACA